ncbi:hypothetical protein GGR52DRAFT_167030 [Hypoxylon sp. FL1284]|nr:hypothetical protein GGR52DRAFT_167030 [Hypoxylon sp. FL1284]
MDVPARRYATSQDWTRLQPIIMRLYLDEDKTLEEVKAHMEEHHEFTTTISMYKKNLARWNAFKNLRPDEVLQILYLKKHRDAARKLSIFFIRDRPIDYDALQVYLSRNPSIFARLEAGATPSREAIQAVSCRSPLLNQSTSVSRSRLLMSSCPAPTMRCNRLLPVSEDMFRALPIYLERCFKTSLWSWSQSDCWNTLGRHGPSGFLSSVLDRCITAGLSATRQVEPGALRRALDVPFAMIIRVFRNPPPILIPKLLSTAAHLNRIGRGEVRALLLQFCRDLTIATYGQDHQLARFWKGFLSVSHLELQDATERILFLYMSEYDKRLGPAHSLSMEAYLKYFDTVERERGPQVQLESLQQRLSKADNTLTSRSLHELLKLEHALAVCKLKLEKGQLDEAENALSRLEPDSLAARDESFRCIWLGYVQCLKGDLASAETFYKKSVSAARRTGSRDCVLESLYQLETFLIHAGKHLEAERIRIERFRLLQKLGLLVWVDQRDILGLENRTSGPVVTMIHVGSGASNTRWQPSAYAEVAEYTKHISLGRGSG